MYVLHVSTLLCVALLKMSSQLDKPLSTLALPHPHFLSSLSLSLYLSIYLSIYLPPSCFLDVCTICVHSSLPINLTTYVVIHPRTRTYVPDAHLCLLSFSNSPLSLAGAIIDENKKKDSDPKKGPGRGLRKAKKTSSSFVKKRPSPMSFDRNERRRDFPNNRSCNHITIFDGFVFSLYYLVNIISHSKMSLLCTY